MWPIYIGETGVWFDERESQHKYAVKRCDISNSFAAHIAETGHSIKWDDFTFIDGHNLSPVHPYGFRCFVSTTQ